MELNFKELNAKLDTQALLARPLTDWRPILSKECQVYVLGENYLAKRFDQINYKFCERATAKEILVDNLYALLRFKYFPISSEKIDERIDKIVSSFIVNLKTSLLRVSFDTDTDAVHLKFLPDSCVAFRNGVFDFKKNDWLFKYNIIDVPSIMNHIYAYDNTYAILWYLNIVFEPLPFSIQDTSLQEFMSLLRAMNKESENYCYELVYNMSHNIDNKYDIHKTEHLCEVIGYAILQSFSQHFVLLIGSGQNGKNSLFDGCFSHKIVPAPASVSLSDIEEDDFITGTLENKSHNIFLETEAETITKSKMLKQLTGSTIQSIHPKGITKYTGFLNCKMIFAGNDQDQIKFSDNTPGFRRRINVYEVWYHWDEQKKFLQKGDYYDVSFSDDYNEIKGDLLNTITFVYLAMYGIQLATDNFTRNFHFTYNDWRCQYVDADFDLKEKLESITPDFVTKFAKYTKDRNDLCKTLFFMPDGNRLYLSSTFKNLGYRGYDDIWKLFNDEEAFMSFFAENDVYMSMKIIQMMLANEDKGNVFTANFKKIYPNADFKNGFYNNQNYVKVTFRNMKLKVV